MKRLIAILAAISLLAFGLVIRQNVTAVSQTVCIPAPSGLVAWWPGDGNANDIAGGRHGVPVNGATFGPGLVAQAFSFNGASWVEVPDDPVWTLGTNDFTIDLWVNFNGLGGRDPFIGHDDGGGEQNKWIFWYDAGGHDKLGGVPALRFHINSPHPNPIPFPHDTVVAPWNPVLGRWYHVAVTRSGNTYTLYIDGSQAATDTSTFSIPDPSVSLTIGRAEGFALNGLVDEVEIHSRALSAQEIFEIFAAGAAGKCKGAATVSIDIKPGNDPNSINCRNQNGVIPVAILTTRIAAGESSDFDATTVDPLTVRFGRNGSEAAEAHNRGHIEDVDGDSDLDLMLHFRIGQTGIQCGDTSANLTGRTFDNRQIRGSDSIRTVGN